MGSPSLPVEGDTLSETLSGTASANTATNMRVLLSTLALTMSPVSCLPSPGMLVLTHMEPQDTEDASITIENGDTRLQFENMQKVSTFQVRLHEGSCARLEDS